MGQRRIKRRRRVWIDGVRIDLPDLSRESLAKDSLASYRIISEYPEDLTIASAYVFKYGWLENARVLAREKTGRCELLLAFENDQARARARENITAFFTPQKDDEEPSPIEEIERPDLEGWRAFGLVMPKSVSDGIVRLMSEDQEFIESQALGILARQESNPDGDYVFPNLSKEEAEYWRKVRDQKKQ